MGKKGKINNGHKNPTRNAGGTAYSEVKKYIAFHLPCDINKNGQAKTPPQISNGGYLTSKGIRRVYMKKFLPLLTRKRDFCHNDQVVGLSL